MEAKALKQIVEDYRLVFGSPEGKRVLAELERMFSERPSVIPGDPFGTHVQEGARQVVLHIKRQIFLGTNPRALSRLTDKPPIREDVFDG